MISKNIHHISRDFGILLGDNFYVSGVSGVSGVDDPQWQDKFELPYSDLTFPIYAVLGNHDCSAEY
ncbi:MAG: metallophosphoesterase [Myxococcales bacterium]|nr:metallophosphoesterase [Myxococcales bacterium]